MKRLILVFLALLMALSLFGAGYRVNASVNKLRLSLNEQLNYTIRIVGDSPVRVADPEPPVIKGMVYRNMLTRSSSSMSLFGSRGGSEFYSEYTYVFLPSQTGKFTIPSQKVSVGGKTYVTQSFVVEVVQGAGGASPVPAPSVPPSPFDPYSWGDEDFWQEQSRPLGDVALVSIPSSGSVYKAEPVIVSYYLYSTQAVGSFQLEAEDDFPGYGKEVYFQPSQLDYQRVTYKGRQYLRALIKQLVLSPNTVGEIQVPRLSGSARVYDYGYQSRALRSEPSSVRIMPLPGIIPPASFTGAVGKLSVSHSISPRSVKVGDAITYKLIIEGRANFHQFTAPQFPKGDGIQVSTPQITDNLNGGVDGKRTVFYTIIPDKEGKLTLPELEFSWFDSSTGKYQTFKGEPAVIEVKPGNVLSYFSDMLGSDDPHELKPLSGKSRYHRYILFPKTVWWWLAVIVLLAGIGVSGSIAWEASLRSRDPRRYATITSRRILAKYFREAQLAAQNLSGDFYTLAENGLMEFLARKYKLSGRLSNAEKLSLLQGMNLPGELLESLSLFIARCQEARYMPGGRDASSINDDLSKLESIVREFIRLNKTEGGDK